MNSPRSRSPKKPFGKMIARDKQPPRIDEQLTMQYPIEEGSIDAAAADKIYAELSQIDESTWDVVGRYHAIWFTDAEVDYDYAKYRHKPHPCKDLPPTVSQLMKNLSQQEGYNSMLVNRFPAGVGINRHTDKRDTVVKVVAVGRSGRVLTFQPRSDGRGYHDEPFEVATSHGSWYEFNAHAVEHTVSTDADGDFPYRFSLTFRPRGTKRNSTSTTANPTEVTGKGSNEAEADVQMETAQSEPAAVSSKKEEAKSTEKDEVSSERGTTEAATDAQMAAVQGESAAVSSAEVAETGEKEEVTSEKAEVPSETEMDVDSKSGSGVTNAEETATREGDMRDEPPGSGCQRTPEDNDVPSAENATASADEQKAGSDGENNTSGPTDSGNETSVAIGGKQEYEMRHLRHLQSQLHDSHTGSIEIVFSKDENYTGDITFLGLYDHVTIDSAGSIRAGKQCFCQIDIGEGSEYRRIKGLTNDKEVVRILSRESEHFLFKKSQNSNSSGERDGSMSGASQEEATEHGDDDDSSSPIDGFKITGISTEAIQVLQKDVHVFAPVWSRRGEEGVSEIGDFLECTAESVENHFIDEFVSTASSQSSCIYIATQSVYDWVVDNLTDEDGEDGYHLRAKALGSIWYILGDDDFGIRSDSVALALGEYKTKHQFVQRILTSPRCTIRKPILIRRDADEDSNEIFKPFPRHISLYRVARPCDRVDECDWNVTGDSAWVTAEGCRIDATQILTTDNKMDGMYDAEYQFANRVSCEVPKKDTVTQQVLLATGPQVSESRSLARDFSLMSFDGTSDMKILQDANGSLPLVWFGSTSTFSLKNTYRFFFPQKNLDLFVKWMSKRSSEDPLIEVQLLNQRNAVVRCALDLSSRANESTLEKLQEFAIIRSLTWSSAFEHVKARKRREAHEARNQRSQYRAPRPARARPQKRTLPLTLKFDGIPTNAGQGTAAASIKQTLIACVQSGAGAKIVLKAGSKTSEDNTASIRDYSKRYVAIVDGRPRYDSKTVSDFVASLPEEITQQVEIIAVDTVINCDVTLIRGAWYAHNIIAGDDAIARLRKMCSAREGFTFRDAQGSAPVSMFYSALDVPNEVSAVPPGPPAETDPQNDVPDDVRKKYMDNPNAFRDPNTTLFQGAVQFMTTATVSVKAATTATVFALKGSGTVIYNTSSGGGNGFVGSSFIKLESGQQHVINNDTTNTILVTFAGESGVQDGFEFLFKGVTGQSTSTGKASIKMLKQDG